MNKLPHIFLKRIFKKTGPPIHLIWFITAKCDLRCSHCFYYRQVSTKAEELSYAEINKTISKLPPLLSLSLTGGEPFLRSDLLGITQLLFEKKITKNIVLFSNGFNTENILATTEKILSNCPNGNIFLGISIDGFEEIHDRYRNKKGSYQRAIDTLKGLKNLKNNFSNLNIGIGITLHQGNQAIIKELRDDIYVKLGIKPGITLIRGEPKSPELKNVDAEIYKKTISSLENDRRASQHISLLQTIIATREVLGQKLAYKTFVRQSRSYYCYAGSLMGVIYENGDVHPCEILKDSCFGNLRDYNYDITKIWKSKKANQIRKLIGTGNCFCTYECQYTCNTLYNIRFLPYFIRDILKYFINFWIVDRIKTKIIRRKNE